MRKLVFFLGPAGAGKTTLAKALARRRHAALFDMDTLSRPASEAILTLSGLDPNDRDSDVYKIRCRDLGYRITMDATLENVDLGVNAFVIGPFTRELEDPVWPEKELRRIDASLHDVDVKAILVSLPGEQHYRERIRDRGLALDAWKLENWSEFSRSLAVREIRWKLPASSILSFNNAGPLSEEKLRQIERFIYGDESEA
ncbi:AAA family ATPase [Paenibacillus elgii]|uniref:AAA family ATPase n=1 Tax=Paenibacillus elgii TaxID=189691 RepID=UPI000248C44A|nr:AAA family ATPase [Paenibacillus elgii]